MAPRPPFTPCSFVGASEQSRQLGNTRSVPSFAQALTLNSRETKKYQVRVTRSEQNSEPCSSFAREFVFFLPCVSIAEKISDGCFSLGDKENKFFCAASLYPWDPSLKQLEWGLRWVYFHLSVIPARQDK